MLLEKLRHEVCEANLSLVSYGLVIFTWGNVSGIDRESGLVVIKPSGVDYDKLTPESMVVVRLDGSIAEGSLRPSSDTPTHLALYKAFSGIGGVTHTHSTYATAFAQAGRCIPAYGTTHGDYFYGTVPCTPPMTDAEITGEYEAETGNVIIRTLGDTDPLTMPGVLVRSHGPFTWGRNAKESADLSLTLEEIAKMAILTERLGNTDPMQKTLLDKHFLRKHGKNAYYGQK